MDVIKILIAGGCEVNIRDQVCARYTISHFYISTAVKFPCLWVRGIEVLFVYVARLVVRPYTERLLGTTVLLQ